MHKGNLHAMYNLLKGEGYIFYFVRASSPLPHEESIPSKDVYVFFILRRRVQRRAPKKVVA